MQSYQFISSTSLHRVEVALMGLKAELFCSDDLFFCKFRGNHCLVGYILKI
jgi:hypothetical protein